VTYRVSRSVDGADYESLALVPATAGPSLTDTSAPALTTVAYKVSTIDPSGESSPSAAVTVHTQTPPAPLEVRPATMSCMGCHSAHSARATEVYPGADGRCFACHDSDIGERLSGEGAGTRHDLFPADQSANGTRLECENCHHPHITSESTPVVDPDDPSPFGGMTSGSDALCLRCHDASLPTSAETTVWAPVPLGMNGAGTAGNIAATWNGDVHGAGASIDPRLRSDMGYTQGDTLTCASCHDPHGSTNRWALHESVPSKDGTSKAEALLVRTLPGGGADLRLYCAGCHTLSSHPAAADGGADLTQWPIDCTACHSHGSRL